MNGARQAICIAFAVAAGAAAVATMESGFAGGALPLIYGVIAVLFVAMAFTDGEASAGGRTGDVTVNIHGQGQQAPQYQPQPAYYPPPPMAPPAPQVVYLPSPPQPYLPPQQATISHADVAALISQQMRAFQLEQQQAMQHQQAALANQVREMGRIASYPQAAPVQLAASHDGRYLPVTPPARALAPPRQVPSLIGRVGRKMFS